MRLLAVLGGLITALTLAAPAQAHENGKAEPRIAAGISQDEGLAQTVRVRLTDADSGKPVRGARVVARAEMEGGAMTLPSIRLREVRPSRYEGRIEFLHPGRWIMRIQVGGANVMKASAQLLVTIGAQATTEPSAGEPPPVEILSTTVTAESSLTGGDYTRMAMLWVHILAATGWILGVLVMALGLSTRPEILAETARERLGRWYLGWGAWAHWALVLVVVGTGVYNMTYVTPFDLVLNPARMDELRQIPYGLLYEGILLTKLGLFAVLLLTGTVTLLRTLELQRPVVPATNPHPGFLRVLASTLGLAGLVYLATVPLILGAAIALRYVHILNHVAGVVSHG